MNFPALYDKLESLTSRLPAGIQTPLLREIGPIKTIFLQQRSPRILLVGERSASRSALVNAIFGGAVAAVGEDSIQDGAWQVFASKHGKLRVLDARSPVALSLVKKALSEAPADLCIFAQPAPGVVGAGGEPLERMRELLAAISQPDAASIPLFGVTMEAAAHDAEVTRHALHAALESVPGNPPVVGSFVLSNGASEVQKLTAGLAAVLPSVAKLEMARLSGLVGLQRELAESLIKAAAAICGLVGTEPIPLADFPILTALQSMMVTGIVNISGREMSPKLVSEWLAAVGANIGVGLVLRESSRAALKFVPFWGNMVSGGIAAAGTYAVGRAATAYFIEGMSLADAQRLFRERKKTERLEGEKRKKA